MKVIHPNLAGVLAPIIVREAERFRIIQHLVEHIPRGKHEDRRIRVIVVELPRATVEVGVPVVVRHGYVRTGRSVLGDLWRVV